MGSLHDCLVMLATHRDTGSLQIDPVVVGLMLSNSDFVLL